ncbi:hypothetical protein GBA52_021385 [Prunus armeniaca]|nr:hypothetical protein GBA52_021385 [Prunus armeniaca]
MSNQHLFDTDSDEEIMEEMFVECEISQKKNVEKATHGGLSSRMRYVPREREAGHMRLMKYYFCVISVYNVDKFWRRFRMRPSLFNRILEQLQNSKRSSPKKQNKNESLSTIRQPSPPPSSPPVIFRNPQISQAPFSNSQSVPPLCLSNLGFLIRSSPGAPTYFRNPNPLGKKIIPDRILFSR